MIAPGRASGQAPRPPDCVGRIPPDDLNQLLQPIFDPDAKRKAKVIAKGINAGPGAATGIIKFFADDAEAHVNKHGKPDAHGKRDPGGRVILVRRETSPEDIRGMQAADGILTGPAYPAINQQEQSDANGHTNPPNPALLLHRPAIVKQATCLLPKGPSDTFFGPWACANLAASGT